MEFSDIFNFKEPTNMLDLKAIIWLENYLEVIAIFKHFKHLNNLIEFFNRLGRVLC